MRSPWSSAPSARQRASVSCGRGSRAFSSTFRSATGGRVYSAGCAPQARLVAGGDPPRAGGDPPRAGGDPPRAGGDPPRAGGDPPRAGGDPPRAGGDPPPAAPGYRVAPVASRVKLVEHAVLADRLSVLRDRRTTHGQFRQALFEAAAIMAVEVARELPMTEVEIQTPLEATRGRRLREEVTVVPVLRAGLGMVEGFLRLLPDARVGHVGIYRDEQEHVPVHYYERLPPGLPEARVYVLDPMLATGGSAVRALQHLRDAQARQVELVCLVAAPEGIEAVAAAHPDVPIWTAAIDRELDENAYIRPGLGDAGDRVFGTA